MFVKNRRRIVCISFIITALSWICETRSHTDLTEAVNQFEDLSETGESQNKSQHLNLGYFHIVEGISVGIENAVEECKNQFQLDRWNCPVESSTLLTKTSVFKGTREAAYLQAISAAGIMYHVTKKCSHPNNNICGCNSKLYKRMRVQEKMDKDDERKGVTWNWRGCMQNVWFGEKVSRIFLGTNEETSTSLDALKRHNEIAGLKAVKDSLKVFCKCHGPTGGCTFKTCWKVLPDFRQVASDLKKRYTYSKSITNQQVTLRASNKVSHRRYKKVSRSDLVYSENSPNYCVPDNTIGYLGTKGRECKKLEKGQNRSTMSRWDRSSCKRLCKGCGYKIKRIPSTETFECDCEFHWCCTVNCKECQRKVSRYFCK